MLGRDIGTVYSQKVKGILLQQCSVHLETWSACTTVSHFCDPSRCSSTTADQGFHLSCNAQELERLIDLHYLDPDAQRESGLTITDHRLLLGALQYKHKTCACQLPMHEMLSYNACARQSGPHMLVTQWISCQQSARDHDAAGGCVHAREERAAELPNHACNLQIRCCRIAHQSIVQQRGDSSDIRPDHDILSIGLACVAGYTRVPVYEGESRQNIVGILYRYMSAARTSLADYLTYDSSMHLLSGCSKPGILG